jgi:lysine biosynthesis protein LysW
MAIAVCPSCEGEIKITQQVKLEQKIRCPYCFEDLEVIETNPIELDWAFDDEEEWEDAWDEDDFGANIDKDNWQ